MFIAIYEMVAKVGQESEFEQAWAEVTDHIYARYGSLGSRLHKTEKPRTYVAYAQWPSRDVYFADHAEGSDEEIAARDRMNAAKESSRTLHLMDVCDDRLRSETA